MVYRSRKTVSTAAIRSVLKSTAETKNTREYIFASGYGCFFCPLLFPSQGTRSTERTGLHICASNLRLEVSVENTNPSTVEPAYVTILLISHTDGVDLRGSLLKSFDSNFVNQRVEGHAFESVETSPDGASCNWTPMDGDQAKSRGIVSLASVETITELDSHEYAYVHNAPLYLTNRRVLWKTFVKLDSTGEPNLEGHRYVQQICSVPLDDNILISTSDTGYSKLSRYYSVVIIINNPTKIKLQVPDGEEPPSGAEPTVTIAATLSYKDV